MPIESETAFQPKYPKAIVHLSEIDGNVFNLIANTRRALMWAGAQRTEVEAFISEATSGDYDHVVQTIMRWVDCD